MSPEATFESLRFWFSIVEFLITAGVWLYVWVANRNRVTQESAQRVEKELRGKIQTQEIEITTLKANVHALPTQIQMAAISNKVGEIDGDMKGVKAELKGLNEKFAHFTSSVERIEDFLLNRKP